MSYDFDQQQPQGLSSGAKTAIGCGLVTFVFMALVCGGIVWFVYLTLDKAQEVVQVVIKEMEKQVEAFAVRFEEEGYQRVSGQVVEVTNDIEKPTVYTVQVFRLEADSAADLAVMAQVAEINGTINGDLHFLGQSLTIHPDAVITGNLHVQMAQVVDNQGTVKGEVVEDDRLDLNLPGPTMPPDLKPPPGDVIEKQAEDAAPADENAAAPAPEEDADESISAETPPSSDESAESAAEP